MGKAKECDVCKTLYKENQSKYDIGDLLDLNNYVFLSGKPKLSLTSFILNSGCVKKKYDVCDNCGEKIAIFLKGLIK